MNPFKYISNFFKSFSSPTIITTSDVSDYKDTFWGRLAYRFTHGAKPVFADADVENEPSTKNRLDDSRFDERPYDDEFDDEFDDEYKRKPEKMPEDDLDDEFDDELDNEPEDAPEEPVSGKLPWYQRVWRAIFGPSRKEAQAEVKEAQEDLEVYKLNELYQPSTPNVPEEKIPANVVRVAVTDIDRFDKERKMIEDRLNKLRDIGKCTEDFYNDVTKLISERPYDKDSERNFLAFMPDENFNNLAQNYKKPVNSKEEISLRDRLDRARSKTSDINKLSTPQRNEQLNTSASKEGSINLLS